MSPAPDTPRSPRSAAPTERLRRLHRFAAGLLRQRTLADLLWDIAGNVGGLMGFEDCVVYLVEGDTLVQRAAFGPKNPREREILEPLSVAVGNGITGHVAATGRPELIGDTRLDTRYIVDQFHGLSELTVPFVYRDRVLGIIDCECSRTHGFDEADLDTLVQVATIAAPRIAHALEEEQRRNAERRLERAHQDLVVRVEERTRELRETVTWLEEEIVVRREVEAALARERRWLSATLRALTEAVFAVDSRGAIRDLSDSAAELLGVPRDRLIGQDLAVVYRPRRIDDGEPVDVARLVSLAGPSAFRVPVLVIDATGTEREFEQSVAPVDGGSDDDSGRVVVLTGFDARVDRRLRLLEREKQAALGELGSAVAQEVNDLLSRIVGNVEIARADVAEPRVVTESLASIRDACRRGRQLTSQLLNFARGPVPKRRPIAVYALIDGAIRTLADEFAARVALSVAPDVPDIAVDVDQFRSVVAELAINAFRAMDETGRLHIEVVATTRARERRLRVEVTDEGPGIPAADLARVFEPCFTTRNDALGLGLANVHAIVTRHDGQIEVGAAPSGGARFAIELPYVEDDAAARVEDLFGSPRLRVLGVEAHAEARVALRRLMRHLGHDVDVVADAVTAAATFAGARDAERPFQVLLLDADFAAEPDGSCLLAAVEEVDPSVRLLLIGQPPAAPASPRVAHVARPLRASAVGRELRRLFRDR